MIVGGRGRCARKKLNLCKMACVNKDGYRKYISSHRMNNPGLTVSRRRTSTDQSKAIVRNTVLNRLAGTLGQS